MNHTHKVLGRLVAAVTILASATLLAATTTSPTTPTQPALEPVALTPHTIAQRLSWIDSLPDDNADADLRQQLGEALDRTDDASQKVELGLALANWELSEPVALAATRWCIGYRTRTDLELLAGAAARAEAALDRADDALASMPSSDDPAVERERRRWEQTRERIGLFTNAMAALGHAVPASSSPDAVQDAMDRCADAALDLVELRESEHTPTAAAATLWQALLLQAAGRTDRALATLDPALLPPAELPYEFFQRIVRCQMLAERGSHALVYGFFIRMNAVTDEWFVGQSERINQVRATIALARAIVLQAWAAAPPADDDDANSVAQWVEQHALPTQSPPTMLRPYLLEPAIPVYQSLPDLTAYMAPPATPATATAATTQPASEEPPATRPAGRPGQDQSSE